MKKETARLSKFISLVLRHNPDQIVLRLDENGWADVQELIEKLNRHGAGISISILEDIVCSNDKQRFRFSADKAKIRANQGHSIDVDLELQKDTPPDLLFHGTATKYLSSILKDSIHSGQRNHVHLSADIATAKRVGARHGSPVILKIHAKAMHAAGHSFFLSGNNVWLTAKVPAEFLVEES